MNELPFKESFATGDAYSDRPIAFQRSDDVGGSALVPVLLRDRARGFVRRAAPRPIARAVAQAFGGRVLPVFLTLYRREHYRWRKPGKDA